MDVAVTAAGLADILASIESGELAATATQQAYISGALHALRAVLGEVDIDL